MTGDYNLEMDGSDSETRMARVQQSHQEEPVPVSPSPTHISPPITAPPVTSAIVAPPASLPPASPPLSTPTAISQPPTNQAQPSTETFIRPVHSPGSSYPAQASPFSKHSGSSVASSSQVQAQLGTELSTNGDAGLHLEEISDDESERQHGDYGLSMWYALGLLNDI